MAITDADQLLEVEWRLGEDPTFASGLWTLTEVAALFNQRQNRFNRDTFLLLAQEPIAATAGVASYTLPDDWIATQRVSWRNTAGAFSVVDRADRLLMSLGLSGTGSSRPLGYDDTSGGSRIIEIAPVPLADGTLNLLYACTLELMDFDGTGDIFDIPDDFVPYITYGVLADLLSKEGRGRDLSRSAYCEARYQEGMALAAIFLGGWV